MQGTLQLKPQFLLQKARSQPPFFQTSCTCLHQHRILDDLAHPVAILIQLLGAFHFHFILETFIFPP
jgi:hypothetical protein